MVTITDYKLITDCSYKNFEASVKTALNEGWAPFGNICANVSVAGYGTVSSKTEHLYTREMAKFESPKEDDHGIITGYNL